MSLVWQTVRGDTSYQVRTAGNSVRLYSNGVFHSQWNPQRVMTDALWDLLTLPAYFLMSPKPQRVLVLGVGGGAVCLQLKALFQPALITGIELDETHLQIARDWFGANSSDINLICADARHWLQSYRGPGFDYVVDDLFSHDDGEPKRAIDMDQQWVELLSSVLTKDGILVANFPERAEQRASTGLFAGCGYVTRLSLGHPGYHNVMGIYSRSQYLRAQWVERLSSCSVLRQSQKKRLLQYRFFKH